MSSEPKLLKIFTRGIEQRFKVYDGTDETSIIHAAKKALNIDADDSRIFLQDDEGDIVIIPHVFPKELKLFLYIQPELVKPQTITSTDSPQQMLPTHSPHQIMPSNPPHQMLPAYSRQQMILPHSNQQVINIVCPSLLLPGFKWMLPSNIRRAAKISDDGYTLFGMDNQYANVPDPAVSTEIYTHGKLYCKLIITPSYYQNIGVCSPDYDGSKVLWKENGGIIEFNSFYKFDHGIDDKPQNFAFLLDMESKTFNLFHFKSEYEIEQISVPFNYSQVRIYAWVKKDSFTILEGGSSLIPPSLIW